MENILPIHLQEVLFGSSDSAISKKISKLENAGKIKKIAPRLYTSNFSEEPAKIVQRNLFAILGNHYPGAVLSHRSALEFNPTKTGQIFLTYSYTKKVFLPGITIHFLKGHGPIDGDNPISGELYVSQRERAFLENLQLSRKTGSESKTLSRDTIEEKLEKIIRVYGEPELNKIRDCAKKIAGKLKMQHEYEQLNKIIGALLQSHPAKLLTSPAAIARAFGLPYDTFRVELFGKLFQELKQQEYSNHSDRNKSDRAFKNFAFFESYFSNYIEGTEFEIGEARKIIETQKPILARNNDSHDILGAYRLVSNRREMQITPKSPDEMIKILKYRHAILLSARENTSPGQFKDKNNRAGQTYFVDFNLVHGTLIKSYDYYSILSHPFAKAAYIMFVISEIHPFIDGNGRIARVMMNAEMVKNGLSKIIIPTVYRENYLLSLRKLSRGSDAKPFIKMLFYAYKFSSYIHGNNIDQMQNYIERCNAFYEPAENKLKIIS